MGNNEYCEICLLPGLVIECDECPRSFHRICLNDIKVGTHFKCEMCRPRHVPLIKNRFFSDLIRIPVMQSFKLPNYIQKLSKIEQWGIEGSVSTSRKTPDDFTLCYACSCGGMVNNRMTQCYVCKDWYHHDCVTPPIIIEPQNWLCPKHINHDVTERYYAQVPELTKSDLIAVHQRPKFNSEAMKAFGVAQPLYLPGEAIRRQFVSKIQREGKDERLLTNHDLALRYLKSIQSFADDAIKTIKNRFCLADENIQQSFKKLEELKAMIEVIMV
eukprot:NODE_43_length_28809_cov_0.237200.p13 type:complete len:272 gc:universal NODE_43_length_28809_cov_0.237200:10217-9402(-)